MRSSSRSVLLLFVTGAACLVTVFAWAYWSGGGTGAASATVSTLAAPSSVTPGSAGWGSTVPVSWTGVTAPNGGTPLGNALTMAGRAVLNSGLTRKHVLIITDGENTIGPKPDVTLAALQQEAGQKQTGVSVHFVAFDVDAKVFAGVKRLGATVVGASNENQLNTQLEFILEKKILLEDEEPPKKK